MKRLFWAILATLFVLVGSSSPLWADVTLVPGGNSWAETYEYAYNNPYVDLSSLFIYNYQEPPIGSSTPNSSTSTFSGRDVPHDDRLAPIGCTVWAARHVL